MEKLTDEERRVLDFMTECWCEVDYPLPGDISYRTAHDLLKRLGVGEHLLKGLMQLSEELD